MLLHLRRLPARHLAFAEGVRTALAVIPRREPYRQLNAAMDCSGGMPAAASQRWLAKGLFASTESVETGKNESRRLGSSTCSHPHLHLVHAPGIQVLTSLSVHGHT